MPIRLESKEGKSQRTLKAEIEAQIEEAKSIAELKEVLQKLL